MDHNDTPDANPLAHWLEHAPPFSELTTDQRDWLTPKMACMTYSTGAAIASHRPDIDPARELWLILSGEVAIQTPDGQPLETRRAGEVFGHAIVFDDPALGQAGYQSVARTDVTLAHCPAETLAALIGQADVVASFVSLQPADRLRALMSDKTGRVSDLNLTAPITGQPSDSIQSVAATMAAHRISSLPLVDQGRLVGIVTDRDLRSQVLAVGLDPNTPVEAIMSRSPKTVSVEALVDDAMLLMMQSQIHHLPVMGSGDRLVGLISAGDLLRTQAPHPLRLARDMARADSQARLAELSKLGPQVLASMVRQGSEVTEVGRVASMLTDTITQRLLVLAEQALGPAPMGWCWVAFGSQARMEQGLISDQDNGLILEAEPDPAAADYFKAFATQVCDGLNACGYVYCNGGVMAMGQWRMSLAQWRQTFSGWMRQPDPQSIMNCSIFFDQRAIGGDAQLLEALQQDILHHAQDATIFLRFLAAEAMRHTPALGVFNRFVQEGKGEEDSGINLKKRGVLPIVDLARVRALEGAITATHTEMRLQHAGEQGVMNPQDADDLIHALRFIGNVRLKHQVKRLDDGLTPNHLVDPDELSRLHQRYLRSAFGIVRRAHQALGSRYQL